MRKLLLAALILLAGAVPALAFDTPEALLKALYAPYGQKDFDWSTFDETKYRSNELNVLFAKDEKEADGEVGRLDFDPYVDGQDYQLTDMKFGAPTITGDKAVVHVMFKNMGDAEDLTFTFVKEADGWKIDDVSSKKTGDEYDLKAIMSGPLVQ
jgi:hypothetical protein